jgi:PKD repeat protein
MKNPEWAPYDTFFVYYVELDYVNAFVLLFPNETGSWNVFPYGNGTVATITFKAVHQPIEPQPPANCILKLSETLLLDEDVNEIPHNIEDGYYEVQPLRVPMLAIEPKTYNAWKKGEVFQVNVTISNVDVRWHLVLIQFRISYDPKLLEVLNVSEGPFMKNSEWAPYDTFFVSFVEKDGLYGPHVLVGNLLFPNETGSWNVFPYGNGTVATITFKAVHQPIEPQPPANCTFNLFDVLLLDDDVEEIPFNTTSGYYEIPSALYPIASFTYDPSFPSAGEVTIFNATTSYDPDGTIMSYYWDFDDGTIINTTEPVIGHVYSQQKTFNVTLTVTDIDGLSSNITKSITIGYYKELTVNIDVGSIHFAGELADFYILTSDIGRRIDATSIKATLYYNGSLFADLTNVTQHISTGLYRIAYEIPANAESGTYTLIVEAECYSVKGTNLKSFLISSTLSGFITDITQGIATVSNGLAQVKLNLTAIDAKLVSIEGKIGIINSTLGTLKIDITKLNATLTDLIVNSKREILANVTTSLNTLTVKLDAIDAKIVAVNGTIATISTTLGEANVKLGDVQSLATTALYVTSILSAIAVILAAAILIFIRKK